jgi:alkyldihydroxyacetonephosphate synthase
MTAARMKHFGWGREGEGLTPDEEAFVIARAERRFGTALTQNATPPELDEITLEAPRVRPPTSLMCCSSDHYDPVAHTYGKSYPELTRGLARDYTNAPDVVAYPSDESEIAAVLDWAGSADLTVTTFGGGSSVCGGVEPRRGSHRGAVTIDMRRMGQVREVDMTSRAALIEAAPTARRSRRSCVRTGSSCAIFRKASNTPRSAAG